MRRSRRRRPPRRHPIHAAGPPRRTPPPGPPAPRHAPTGSTPWSPKQEREALLTAISESIAEGFPADAGLTDAQRDLLNRRPHQFTATYALTDADEAYLEWLMDQGYGPRNALEPADPEDPHVTGWIRRRREDIAELESPFGPGASFDAIRDFVEDLETTDDLPHGLTRSEADAIIQTFRFRVPHRDGHGAEFTPLPNSRERSAASGGLAKIAALFAPPSLDAKAGPTIPPTSGQNPTVAGARHTRP